MIKTLNCLEDLPALTDDEESSEEDLDMDNGNKDTIGDNGEDHGEDPDVNDHHGDYGIDDNQSLHSEDSMESICKKDEELGRLMDNIDLYRFLGKTILKKGELVMEKLI